MTVKWLSRIKAHVSLENYAVELKGVNKALSGIAGSTCVGLSCQFLQLSAYNNPRIDRFE